MPQNEGILLSKYSFADKYRKNYFIFEKLIRERKEKRQKSNLPSGGLEPAFLLMQGHSLNHYANERLVGEWSKAYLYKVWLKALSPIFSVIGPNRLSIFWYVC